MISVQYYNENANDFISTTVNNIEFYEGKDEKNFIFFI